MKNGEKEGRIEGHRGKKGEIKREREEGVNEGRKGLKMKELR